MNEYTGTNILENLQTAFYLEATASSSGTLISLYQISWLPQHARKYFEREEHIPPTDDIPTLSWWWGLSAPKTLRAMPAVASLLVESPRPDRSRGRSQMKRDTLVLQVGGWTLG
jgi:hypothetical protein